MGCCFSKNTPSYPETIYHINIKTSDAYKHAGTDSTVKVELIGCTGLATEKLTLDNFFRDDYERGETSHFRVNARDVGSPIIVRIYLENSHEEDEWLCESITIMNGNKKIYFPVYDWIFEKKEVAPGEAMLPQKVTNQFATSLRKHEVALNKSVYAWQQRPVAGSVGSGLPRFVNATSYDELPRLFKRDIVRAKSFVDHGLSAAISSVLNLLDSWIQPLKNLDSYHRVYSHSKTRRTDDPNYLVNWNSDESMGRQTLTGISPLAFKRCESIPDYFNVTNDIVSPCLEGCTLENAMEKGKLYISDYSQLLKDLERNKRGQDALYCPNSVGLFFVRGNGDFVPVAIQLKPGDADYLFTPNDSENDWLLAKMYFRCAFGNTHEWIYHFLHTHNIMEPFAVSVFRCLPMSHPIYKLLRPHLQTVSAINADARSSLITSGSQANQTLSISALSMTKAIYKTFHMDDLVIPNVIKKHKTHDDNLLPGYYYRDDATELWGIMERFVTAVVKNYYKSNQDVEQDYELQDWVKDVATEGIGWEDGNTKGMPEKLTCIEELVKICVIIIFTSSVEHAAVNFGQYETYKFIPNAPLGMRMDAHKKGEADMQRIMDTLPDIEMATIQFAIGFALSTFSPNDTYLGNYSRKLFCEEPVLNLMKAYKSELEQLEIKIEKRNVGLEHPYTFLLPSRVPNYIGI